MAIQGPTLQHYSLNQFPDISEGGNFDMRLICGDTCGDEYVKVMSEQ